MRSLTALPDMGPVWGSPAPLFSAADTQLPSIYWPWLVDTNTAPGIYPRRYRMYYSTDHNAGPGGIAYAEADQVAGPWTHHPTIYTDTIQGIQTETPSVMWVPERQRWHMYYQQAQVQGGQRSMLAESTDGVNWSRMGIALPIPDGSLLWPGYSSHTGYMIPHRLAGGRWMAYSLLSGGDYPHFAQSWSTDGVTWRIDGRPLGYGAHLLAGLGGRRVEWNSGYLLNAGGGLWWIGCLADWTSGTDVRSVLVAQAPIAPDLRTLLAPPRALYPPGVGNHRAVNVSTDASGETWLLIQTGDTVSYAAGATAP